MTKIPSARLRFCLKTKHPTVGQTEEKISVVKHKLGTLSKNDDEGSEKDGKKMNLRCFKLDRVYLDPLNMSNAGDFSWN